MKLHRAVPTTVHQAVQTRVHRAVQPKVLHKKGERYVMRAFVHLATNIYMYMTIMLYSTLPDKYGAYVEEEPWFDSERQGCP